MKSNKFQIEAIYPAKGEVILNWKFNLYFFEEFSNEENYLKIICRRKFALNGRLNILKICG